MNTITVDQLIAILSALPAEERRLPVFLMDHSRVTERLQLVYRTCEIGADRGDGVFLTARVD